jgi:hypothetical protein
MHRKYQARGARRLTTNPKQIMDATLILNLGKLTLDQILMTNALAKRGMM